MLARNGRSGGRAVRNKHGALLSGLLRCAACQCGMSHSYSRKGHRQYRYYVCNRAQCQGWHACPSPSVPAGEIERFVVEQLRCLGEDPTAALTRGPTDEGPAPAALARLDAVWPSPSPREQARILALLIEQVDYDGQNGRISIKIPTPNTSSL